MKEQPGQDIVLTGSITLCHALITAGLVDEYRLFCYPTVQGRGRRLFRDGYEVPRLRLLETKAFRSGITYSPLRMVVTRRNSAVYRRRGGQAWSPGLGGSG